MNLIIQSGNRQLNTCCTHKVNSTENDIIIILFNFSYASQTCKDFLNSLFSHYNLAVNLKFYFNSSFHSDYSVF
jgi:hypothetical protein